MALSTSFSNAAQTAWVYVRDAGRRALGRERFDALVGALGLRAVKARLFRFAKDLPDGGRLVYRAEDETIVEEVYQDRVYDKDTPIEPGMTVVDAGGHIGAFALYAGRKVGPKGRVLVFEPSPDNLALLNQNLALNKLPQIELFPVALAEQTGEADLFLADPGTENPATNTLFASEGRKSAKVPLAKLDDLAAKAGLNKIDLLKVDVEGAELRVLKGAQDVLARTARVVMEIHPSRVSPCDVTRFLESKGFVCRTLFQKPLIVEGKRR